MSLEFDAAYEELSRVGACDSPGGMEYRRVKREWVKAGKPADVRSFIRVRANWGPDPGFQGRPHAPMLRASGKHPIRAWFVAPVGSITEPVTFAQIPGEATVQVILGDLQNSRNMLRTACRQTRASLVEIDGVDGLAATDPHWDGQSTFFCKNPRCGKRHDVHVMVAENLFARAMGAR